MIIGLYLYQQNYYLHFLFPLGWRIGRGAILGFEVLEQLTFDKLDSYASNNELEEFKQKMKVASCPLGVSDVPGIKISHSDWANYQANKEKENKPDISKPEEFNDLISDALKTGNFSKVNKMANWDMDGVKGYCELQISKIAESMDSDPNKILKYAKKPENKRFLVYLQVVGICNGTYKGQIDGVWGRQSANTFNKFFDTNIANVAAPKLKGAADATKSKEKGKSKEKSKTAGTRRSLEELRRDTPVCECACDLVALTHGDVQDICHAILMEGFAKGKPEEADKNMYWFIENWLTTHNDILPDIKSGSYVNGNGIAAVALTRLNVGTEQLKYINDYLINITPKPKAEFFKLIGEIAGGRVDCFDKSRGYSLHKDDAEGGYQLNERSGDLMEFIEDDWWPGNSERKLWWYAHQFTIEKVKRLVEKFNDELVAKDVKVFLGASNKAGVVFDKNNSCKQNAILLDIRNPNSWDDFMNASLDLFN